MTEDVINLGFLFGACIALLSNCYKTYKDKGVRGISIFNVIFFSCMALYQTYYWFFLGKFFSFIGCALTVIIQTSWLGMIMYYKRLDSNRRTKKVILQMWERE